MSGLPTWWLLSVSAVLGSVLASFLAVVAERVPRGESINGRSHCVCGRQLRGHENIPILGWVLARGRSRCCKQNIPVRYVLGELFLAAMFALGAAIGGWWTAMVWIAGMAGLLLGSWRRPE